MEDSATSAIASLSGQPVIAFLGLKKHQWPKRDQWRIVALDCLESMGINNVLAVECFLKNGRDYVPSLDPGVVNIFLKLSGKNGNGIELIL